MSLIAKHKKRKPKYTTYEKALIAAKDGSLDVIKKLCHKLSKDQLEQISICAAEYEHVHILNYMYVKGLPIRSSIMDVGAAAGSTIIVAWARSKGYSWSNVTAARAARGGHYRVLTQLREFGLEFNQAVIEEAALCGRRDIVKWLEEIGLKYTERVIVNFIHGSIIEFTKSMIMMKKITLSENSLCDLAYHGHTEFLEWLLIETNSEYLEDDIKTQPISPRVCEWAARGCKLGTLKWLRSMNIAWDHKTVSAAASKYNVGIFMYAVKNGCNISTACPYVVKFLTLFPEVMNELDGKK